MDQWGDWFGPIVNSKQVTAFSNYINTEEDGRKKTNLRNKDSCWMALISIVLPCPDILTKQGQIKIPNHAIAIADVSSWFKPL